MLSLKRWHGARPGSAYAGRLLLGRLPGRNGFVAPAQAVLGSLRPLERSLTSSACFRTDQSTSQRPEDESYDMEKTVREAAERYRDSLPTDYLNAREMALYERLYGKPLRETQPEDVGIPSHAGLRDPTDQSDPDSPLLRSGEGRPPEETEYSVTARQETSVEDAVNESREYIDSVARNPREHAAMSKLLVDFEAMQKVQKEQQEQQEKEEQEEQEGHLQTAATGEAGSFEEAEAKRPKVPSLEDDEAEWDVGTYRSGAARRFHPWSLEGHFQKKMTQITIPRQRMSDPIRSLLERSNVAHVRDAAEKAYGGPGLPDSPAHAMSIRKGNMLGMGLHPDNGHMMEIEADAILAAYLTPAYSSALSVLREVRRRLGPEWLQSRMKSRRDPGLSVLDVGGAGAGLLAWEEVLRAEWEVLKQDGQVRGSFGPPQWRKTAVVGSDRLRNRVKTFLHDTTFLSRLPDYQHSGATRGEHLDAGDKPQPRKQYDVVIASHLFLKEEAGHRRQAVLNGLWNTLCKDGGILIVIEKPHPRGFEAMAHVRHTIMSDFFHPQTAAEEASSASTKAKMEKVEVEVEVEDADADAKKAEEAHAKDSETTAPVTEEPNPQETGAEKKAAKKDGEKKPMSKRAAAREAAASEAAEKEAVALAAVKASFVREREDGHIIAPCTTQGVCPMYKKPGESEGRKDSCHYFQRFVQPSFYKTVANGKRNENQGAVAFSYVAIRRGVPRDAAMSGKKATEKAFAGYGDTEEKPDMQLLPRVVNRPLKCTRHVTMDVCTPSGNLERWTVPKSYGRQAYHDARKAQWGDLWALGAKTRVMRKIRDGKGPSSPLKIKAERRTKNKVRDKPWKEERLERQKARLARHEAALDAMDDSWEDDMGLDKMEDLEDDVMLEKLADRQPEVGRLASGGGDDDSMVSEEDEGEDNRLKRRWKDRKKVREARWQEEKERKARRRR